MSVSSLLLCAAQVGNLKQHYLKSEILRSCLLAVSGLPESTVSKELALLGRIACNLDCSLSGGGLLDMLCTNFLSQQDAVKEQVRRHFWQVVSLPVRTDPHRAPARPSANH